MNQMDSKSTWNLLKTTEDLTKAQNYTMPHSFWSKLLSYHSNNAIFLSVKFKRQNSKNFLKINKIVNVMFTSL